MTSDDGKEELRVGDVIQWEGDYYTIAAKNEYTYFIPSKVTGYRYSYAKEAIHQLIKEGVIVVAEKRAKNGDYEIISYIPLEVRGKLLKQGSIDYNHVESDTPVEAPQKPSEAFSVTISYQGSQYVAKDASEAYLVVLALSDKSKKEEFLDKYTT